MQLPRLRVGLVLLYLGRALTQGCGDDTAADGADDASVDAADAGVDAATHTDESDAAPANGAKDAGAAPDVGASARSDGYGQKYTGGEFHLGPVDWAESKFHNACAAATKYPAAVQRAEGMLLAGLWSGLPAVARYCDACIRVETARGKSALLRVVTYGATSANSIDVSPQAFSALDSGEYPRTMTFQLAKCPDTGKLMYEFKSGAHEDWTAFWVRNARIPIESVEIMGVHHGYAAATRESDGSLVDARGVGKGSFSIRVTAVDGQTIVDTFSWPSAGIAGQLLSGAGNFD